ncbi:outer membrane autotransporter barrel domain protein [Candidatus Thiomargarita nelsonii]|uniref:Outer membrane autotransporter barrel domain protein n=1 Tax=Candidatus Thiomargarita nelsonii TaxID=1003181 RepID=A0A0A6NY80_9GAMM|nr:outer membrane autotransporter barrel domain protein [Candidatus Thiomargarita nelsonii]
MFRHFAIYFLLSLIGVVHGATVNLTVSPSSVAEGEFFTLTVSLDSPNQKDSAVVSIKLIEGDKNDLSTSVFPAVTLNNNNQEKSFSIEALKDDLAEATETFTFKIGIIPTGNVTLDQDRQTVSVRDQEVGQFKFTSSSFSVNENAGNAIITVERVNGSDGIATVNYATSNGATGSLTWLDGEMGSKTFTVPIIDNTAIDGDKTVNLQLTNNSSVEIATLTIIDDDIIITEPPEEEEGQIQFTTSLSVNESDEKVSLTVERVGSSKGEFSVNYATRDDTAIAGKDYEAATGTLTWRDGESGSKKISITIKNDKEFEEDETFSVEIKDSAGNLLAITKLTINDKSAEKILIEIGKNPIQRKIGKVLGRICQFGKPTEDLKERCEELINNADEFPNEVANALQPIAPEEFMAQGDIALQSAATQFKNVNARMDVLRIGVRNFRLNLSGLNLNINGQRLPIQLFTDATTKNVGAGFSRLGAFVNGEISFEDKDTTDSESGFELSTLGLTAGIDYRFTNNFIAGMALGYSNSESDLNANGGNIDSDGYSVTLYGTFYQSNDFYIDGLYSYGSNSYDSERNIVYQVVTPINQTAFSSNDSDQHALGLGVGYHFNRQAFTLTPNVRLDYLKTEIDGFSEEFNDPNADGASLGLAIDSHEVESLRLTLGVQADYTLSQSWGILIPHANLDYVHEFKDDVRQLTGRFLDDGSRESFSLSSDAPDRDYFNLGLGLSAQFTQGRAAFIRYEGTLGLRDVERHAIMAGMRLEF